MKHRKMISKVCKILLSVLLCVSLCACGLSAEERMQRLFDEGMDYKAEENYESAVEALKEALQLDDTQVEIYSALAECYVALDDTDAAIAILEQGISVTENASLSDTLKRLTFTVWQNDTISAGNRHSAAIDANGTLWTWGWNKHGQLGNGTTVDSPVPVSVLDNVASVSCGSDGTAALQPDGTLWMWGKGILCGQKEDEIVSKPKRMMDDVVAVSVGFDHVGAIKSDGTLWMWGSNAEGQFGIGTRDKGSSLPVKVAENIKFVSCGYSFSAAIKTDDSLWMWGSNSSYDGQLGNGGVGNVVETIEDSAEGSVFTYQNVYQTVPVKVLEQVAQVNCWLFNAAAVKKDGTLWVWGNGAWGALGNGSEKGSNVPVQIMGQVEKASYGDRYCAAVKNDGTIWTWGINDYGQLGNGDKKEMHAPNKISLENVVAISAGYDHALALTSEGIVWAWGLNCNGQIGNNNAGNATEYLGWGDISGIEANVPIQTVPVKVMNGAVPSVKADAHA